MAEPFWQTAEKSSLIIRSSGGLKMALARLTAFDTGNGVLGGARANVILKFLRRRKILGSPASRSSLLLFKQSLSELAKLPKLSPEPRSALWPMFRHSASQLFRLHARKPSNVFLLLLRSRNRFKLSETLTQGKAKW